MKALWLASWYPSKNDLLTGDFFQRHAHAASLHHEIHVLHIKRDDAISSTIDKSFNQQANLSETIILYKPFLHVVKGAGTLFSAITWFALMKKEIDQWMLQFGKPDIIHVKAAWKCGLMAWWCKKKYGIPYFVSEQYTGYFDEAEGLVPTFNFVQHWLLKKIFQGADKVLPVSDYLGKALKKRYVVDYTVLDNVIDTSIFNINKSKTPNPVFTLLHVSLLNLQKNPDMLFQACCELIKINFKFQLQLVAPETVANYYLLKYPQTKSCIRLLPETKQQSLAAIMQQADVLLFPSAFESFGLVAYESIACGTPVIVTDIEVFTNNLSDKKYVSFCKTNDAVSLAKEIVKLYEDNMVYEKNGMLQFIHHSFSEQAIASKFQQLYKGY